MNALRSYQVTADGLTLISKFTKKMRVSFCNPDVALVVRKLMSRKKKLRQLLKPPSPTLLFNYFACFTSQSSKKLVKNNSLGTLTCIQDNRLFLC